MIRENHIVDLWLMCVAQLDDLLSTASKICRNAELCDFVSSTDETLEIVKIYLSRIDTDWSGNRSIKDLCATIDDTVTALHIVDLDTTANIFLRECVNNLRKIRCRLWFVRAEYEEYCLEEK